MKCYIEITGNCNLRCKHCFNSSGNDNYIEKDVLVRQFVHMKNMGIKEVSLSGGEPLMHNYFWEFVECLHNLEIDIGINTNLILWKREDFEHISKCDNVCLTTSLEGATRETNDKIRGNGHFSNFVNQIELLRSYGVKKCKVHCTINKSNYCEIKEFTYLVEHWGFTPIFSFVENMGRATEHWDELCLSKKEIFESVIEIKRYTKNSYSLVGEDYIKNYCPKKNFLNFLISSCGDVYVCNFIYSNSVKVGNIYNENIFNIINSEKYKDVVSWLCNIPANNCSECIEKVKTDIMSRGL